MLTNDQLREVKDYVLRELPRILEEDPGFVVFIEGIINEKFPRRDEFARLLDEFTGFRRETRENFNKVDERLDKVDDRLDKVDERFNEVDERFNEVDERFEKVNQRFDEVDQRFQEVNERFERVDAEFATVHGEIRNLRQEMHEGFERLTQEMRDLRCWVELNTGRLQVRVGHQLEDVVAGALRLGLERKDIQPEHVRLRQKISDPTGAVYRAGKEKEVDLIAQNDEILVFEVKSAADPDDVDTFADKVQLVRLQYPDKKVEGVLISLGAEENLRKACEMHGIKLIP